jgi:hypothetical protein
MFTKFRRFAQLQLAYQIGKVGNIPLPTEKLSCFIVLPAIFAVSQPAEIADADS